MGFLDTSGAKLTVGCNHTVQTPVAAAVYLGDPGKKGARICELGDGVSPFVSPCPIDAQKREALLKGSLYVTISSDIYPQGEIRGQIR